MSNSYTRHRASRPIRYRTPSPPRNAVEPISPIAIAWLDEEVAQIVSSQNEVKTPMLNQCGLGKTPHQARYTPNGAMEIFAEIALSTQANKQAQVDNPTRKRPLAGPELGFPSSKRSRSEKLPSPEMSRKQIATATRPATSHEQTTQSRMIEAELLLNFSSTARLACPFPIAVKRQIDQQSFQAPRETFQESSRLPSFPPPLKEASNHENRLQQPKIDEVKQNSFEGRGSTTVVPPSQSCASQDDEASSTLRPLPGAKDTMPLNTLEDVQDKALVDVLEDAINGISDSEAMILNTTYKNMSQKLKSTTPAGLLEKELGNDESCVLHVTPGDKTIISRDIPLIEADVMAPKKKSDLESESRTKDRLKPTPEFDAPPNTDISNSEKTRSAASCAACKFQRNSSTVDGDNTTTSWISCDGCKSWFHFACAGFRNEREVRAVDKFRCKKCKSIHGATTYVRKSSRAHSAIDYAGLHQGVIKTSDERMEHHYIQPIKDGVITFMPENFARMRPELVTAEFFEKSGGMKEPVLIPADFNPRPSSEPTADSDESIPLDRLAETQKADNLMTGDSEYQIVPDEGQDALDMVIPRGLTVKQVAELYGPDEKVEVIDVKSQNGENKKWNMRRWAEYYENPNNKVVRNVISLEVSQSKLGRLIRRPRIVRDLDLQDSVWPEELLARKEYPRVQFYCLMSVADCFTDFHIDFGGSSVFYHILKGKKTFLFIPPKEKHLKKYEEWCMSPAQNWTFLADQTKECYRVDLSEGDTMLIPSGWIHAVWTPEDSLVIGGNFLTRMNFGMQLRIAQVEKATGVARKFRYPHFQKLHWFTAFRYMEEDPLPHDLKEEFHRGELFPREQPIYDEFDAWGENSRPGRRNYNARYYSHEEIEGLRDLTAYLLRTVLIDLGKITEGITVETRSAVRKSIPRSHGEPFDVIKNFAAWCAWKRGNELIHHWAYPDSRPEDSLPPEKLSATTMKKLDREAALEAALQAPRRQSARRRSIQQAMSPPSHGGPSEIADYNPSTPSELSRSAGDNNVSGEDTVSFLGEANKKRRTSSGAGTGSNRKTACEACRKRRRACKHKDDVEALNYASNVYSMPSQTDLVGAQPVSLGEINERSDLDLEGVMVVTSQPSNNNHPQDNDSSHLALQQSRLDSQWAIDGAEREQTDGIEAISSSTRLSRPRTKACNDCRKSKRRCIHDAFGNEDPVKVAEQAIPRPHARKNHRIIDSQILPTLSVNEPSRPQEQVRRMAPATSMVAPIANMIASPKPSLQQHLVSLHGAPRMKCLNKEPRVLVSHSVSNKASTLAQEPGEECKAKSTPIEVETQPEARLEGKHQRFIVDETAMADTPNVTEQRPPYSSLISPPASSNDDVGGSPIYGVATYSPSPPPSNLRQHQTSTTMQQRYTPESGTLRRASSSSFEQHCNEVGPNQADKLSSKAPSHELRRSPEILADTESLRLIKELQAQDYGLRRRGKS